MVTRRDRAAGMTLVEIMVTLIISSIIAASTFMFFAGQQRIYDTQTKVLNIQQNLWAAMEVVSRYTRASGSGMFECVRPASYANATLQNGSRLQSTSPSPGPLTATLAQRPQTGVRALVPGTNSAQFIPPLWIVDNATAADAPVALNTDILTVAFGNKTSGTDVDATLSLSFANTGATTPITLTPAGTGSMFRVNEFILLMVTPDWGYGTNPTVDRGCTMFQITADPTGGQMLAHGASTWNPGGDVTDMLPLGGYTANQAGVRNFGALTWVSFFVQQTGDGIPYLMMQQRHLAGTAGTPQVLAEGIEDLQISYACDTGRNSGPNLAAVDGQLNEGTIELTRHTDEWWNNVPDDILPAFGTQGYCNLPTAVRITMVARTLGPDDLIDPAASGNGPLDLENHRHDPPVPDQFRRRVLTTTVYPRNNKPL
jgi:prepilin-type N-terminal cleavage/methylation domain-containing protein